MSDVKICNSKKIIESVFYMSPEGDVLKYKKCCIIHSCKKLGSSNYHNEKTFLYCNEHKLDKIINIRKGYILCEEHNIPYLKFCKEYQKMYCLLCNQDVSKQHYFSKKYIDNFDKKYYYNNKKLH